MAKKSFPLAKVYTLLEPGPVTLVTTCRAGKPNVMTMSWQTMLDFDPPLLRCAIRDRNHFFGTPGKTKVFMTAVPAVKIAERVAV